MTFFAPFIFHALSLSPPLPPPYLGGPTALPTLFPVVTLDVALHNWSQYADQNGVACLKTSLFVMSPPTLAHFPVAFSLPWALIRQSNERCLPCHLLHARRGGLVSRQPLFFLLSTALHFALFLSSVFSACI